MFSPSSCDIAKYPLGIKSPQVEDHWYRGYHECSGLECLASNSGSQTYCYEWPQAISLISLNLSFLLHRKGTIIISTLDIHSIKMPIEEASEFSSCHRCTKFIQLHMKQFPLREIQNLAESLPHIRQLGKYPH